MTDQRRDPPFRFGITLLGYLIVAIFAGGFFTWSKLAPIESAVVAPGIVSVASGVRTVQHLEGGIVQDIMVGSGSEVEEGQVLFRLQNTEPFARLTEAQAEYFETLATEARLLAERDQLDDIRFPSYLTRKLGDRAAQSAMRNQRTIFENRRQLLAEQLTILERTKDAIGSEIEGLAGQIASSEDKLRIVTEELTTAQQLLERKLAQRSTVLKLEREHAELLGEISRLRAEIGSAEQRAAEASLRVSELESLRATAIAEELREVSARVFELDQRIAAAQDIVRRTEIRSPVGGVVVDMNVTTIGGVIAAGEPLLSIVPRNDNLVVQVTIDPLDIDRVREGLEATVFLTSLNRRSHSGVNGVVENISADRVTDGRSGSDYYLARVVLDADEVERSAIPLQPGMGADVMIRTGAQTALNYIITPLSRSVSRAFREN